METTKDITFEHNGNKYTIPKGFKYVKPFFQFTAVSEKQIIEQYKKTFKDLLK